MDAVTKIHQIEIDFLDGISHAIHEERAKQLANHKHRERETQNQFVGEVERKKMKCVTRKLQQK